MKVAKHFTIIKALCSWQDKYKMNRGHTGTFATVDFFLDLDDSVTFNQAEL
jgi:hypothetical protein